MNYIGKTLTVLNLTLASIVFAAVLATFLDRTNVDPDDTFVGGEDLDYLAPEEAYLGWEMLAYSAGNHKQSQQFARWRYHDLLKTNNKDRNDFSKTRNGLLAEIKTLKDESVTLLADYEDTKKNWMAELIEVDNTNFELQNLVVRYANLNHVIRDRNDRQNDLYTQIGMEAPRLAVATELYRETLQTMELRQDLVNQFKQREREEISEMADSRRELRELKYMTDRLVAMGEITAEEMARLKEEIKGPTIRGQVHSVDEATGLVMLTVGSGDKVLKGMKFIVHRRGELIGKIIVDEVTDVDSCSAYIVNDWLRSSIQAGDSAVHEL